MQHKILLNRVMYNWYMFTKYQCDIRSKVNQSKLKYRRKVLLEYWSILVTFAKDQVYTKSCIKIIQVQNYFKI